MQEFVIKLTDIQAVVNFPNLPQRLVIRYAQWTRSGDRQGNGHLVARVFELALNVPRATQAARIYKQLTEALLESPVSNELVSEMDLHGMGIDGMQF